MTTRNRNLHISTFGSEPERILRILKASTADCELINEADFAAQLVRARLVDESWQDERNVLPKQAADNQVEDKTHDEGIDEEEPISENESSNESGHSALHHHDIRHLIREALEEP